MPKKFLTPAIKWPPQVLILFPMLERPENKPSSASAPGCFHFSRENHGLTSLFHQFEMLFDHSPTVLFHPLIIDVLMLDASSDHLSNVNQGATCFENQSETTLTILTPNSASVRLPRRPSAADPISVKPLHA